MTIQIPKKPRSVKIQTPELEELRSAEDGLVSVARHPKNYLYINSGASIHILYNWELLGSLTQLDRPIKIQAGGKPIYLSQIESLHKAL